MGRSKVAGGNRSCRGMQMGTGSSLPRGKCYQCEHTLI